jgi:hypothetical protein
MAAMTVPAARAIWRLAEEVTERDYTALGGDGEDCHYVENRMAGNEK